MASTLKDSLLHWRKKLERTTDENSVLNTIHKLSKVPITVDLLQDTGIGKIIRNLAKKSGKVGLKASSVLQNWRAVVASAQKIPETSPKHEPIKHSSHKRDASSSEQISDEKSRKLSCSSHEKKRKSKHSSDLNHKQKYTRDSSKHLSPKISHSTSNNKHVKNYDTADHLDDDDDEYEHSVNLNSTVHQTCTDLQTEKLFTTKESSGKQHAVGTKTHSVQNGTSGTKKRKMEYAQISDSSDERKHKKEFSHTSNDMPDEKKCKKEYDHISKGLPDERKRKHEVAQDFNGTSVEKKRKHEVAQTSSSYSSLNKNEMVSDSTCKKRDKEKKSRKTRDQKHRESSSLLSQNKIHKAEKSHSKKKDSKKKSSSKLKTCLKIEPTEAFTSSEVRFEDCLSFNDIVPVRRKKSSKSTSEKKEKQVIIKQEIKGSVASRNSTSKLFEGRKTEVTSLPDLIQSQIPHLSEVDIISTLPQTQPNYRPLPQRSYDCSIPNKKKVLSNEEAIKFTSSRREKTSVYSGRKNVFYTEVPTLIDSCVRVLIENIDAIEYIGEVVPYHIVKQVLLRCSAAQLHQIEDYNPYLLDDNQSLWEMHCKKDFRNHKPQENETWRDMYWRAFEEREKKLASITANISASMTTKYKPGRKVQLAYVDSFVKPPREVARKQAKHGTALPVNHPVKAGPPSKASPRPVAPAINSAASHAREIVPKKPKVAPLMAKTLKSMKQCFRR